MKARICTLSILAILACVVAGIHESRVSAAETIIPEEELTVERVKELFEAAFIKCEIDSDGDLKIEDGGLITFVRIEKEKTLLSFFSLWAMKEDAPELQKLQLINSFNDDLIIVRFSLRNATTLWCDYQLSFQDGMMPNQIVQSYRLFFKVVVGAVGTRDPENLIGS
ncbi:MAG: YbjN domain-containing protein [Candidatus Hydrogenedentes bacterium]|nr:YbjN domain-containing protein [Candidatus Hydrogenedentota bacterium]